MKRNRITALLLTAVLVLSLTACGGKETVEEVPPAGTAVQVVTVTQGSIATENKVSGKISADNESTIMVATSAKCTAVYANAGDEVSAGDVICTLDLGSTLSSYNAATISYNSSVQSYQDQKAVFDAQINLYQKNVDDLKALFEIGAASQVEIDQAELQLKSAIATRNSTLSQLEAGMQSAKSNVEQLSTALENVDSKGNVIAPISGTLVTMNAVENSFVSTSMPVAVIDGADQMKVVVSVSETLVPKLAAGDTADVYISSIDQSFTATIRSVERAANVQTKLYTVTLGIPADVTGLLSGMFADVTFHTDVSENTIVVPTEAILTSNDVQYVYVVENDTARYVEVTTLLAVIMIAIFGVVFTTQLQMSLLPDMEAPMALVLCYYNGATPSDIEELVTRPLETAIMSVPGVDSVSSTSSDGVSQIQITYVEDTNLDIAASKLREKFDMLSLPDGAMDPIIVNMNISDLMPTAMIALMGDDLAELQELAEDVVVPALERIDGVASVSINGGVTEQITVEVDPTRAAGFGLSNSYICQFLTAENLLYPGGDVQNGSKTLTVSTDAKFQSVEDVANMIISLPTGGSVRLREVADVRLEATESDTLAMMNGEDCVLLQVSKQSGANEEEVSNKVEKRMASLAAENRSINYALPYLASDFIDLAVSSALQNIILGVVLAAIVAFLFLRRFGATMAIAVSMPVCILAVFVLMNIFDLTLNMMSLGGIAMGVGMIVDNSIVVLENIYRFAAEGHDRMSACVDGTKEVTTSVIASTLTTVAVFIPIGLSGGMAGMLFDDFCLTIGFLILGSMAIALTLVPLLCYMMLDENKVRQDQIKKAEKKQNALVSTVGGWISKLYHLYLRLLDYFVHHLKIGMLVAVGLVVFFVGCCLTTNMVLLPSMDMGQISISISTPIGSQVDETTAIADRVAAIAQENVPELESIYYVSEAESASVALILTDKSDRDRSSDDVADSLRPLLQDIAGCEITITSSDMTALMSGDEISLDITGDDYETLTMIAADLTGQISALEDAVDVTSSVADQVPQVKVTMNREAAAQYGLTAAQVGAAVRDELTGSTATSVTINNKELDVVVKGDGSATESLDALRSMSVATAMGGYVPLSSVANVEVVQAPQTITRSNQSRQVSITGSTLSGDVTAMTASINAILDNYSMPEGYTATISGSYEEMMESFTDLLLALVVALGLVYFVLAAQFESFLMPVIIMMILPVAFSGALFALPLTGRDLSMISLVALIMLAGTVVNNSIVLVDYIKTRREMGESREDAILHACPLRIRPIMMTTLTTVLAMVPMAMAMGDTLEMMSDMGITMISGMIISTIVTLLFTPVFYSVIDDLPRHFRRRKHTDTPEPPADEAAALPVEG